MIMYYPHVTNAPSMLVGTSETVCTIAMGTILVTPSLSDRQWLAGLIDGDGNFHINKRNYVELSVVIEPRDVHCLTQIKQWYGGYIRPFSHTSALRYRLHHKEGLLKLIHDLNGLIQNPVRQAQLYKVCALYDITTVPSEPLTYSSRYLAGLFDSDGSVYYNAASIQTFITLSQKGRYLLDLIQSIYGGKVYFANADKSAYKWSISKKAEVINIIETYFKSSPCVSAKQLKLLLVKDFYTLSYKGAISAQDQSEWQAFVELWKATNTPIGYEEIQRLIKGNKIS